MAAEAAPPQSSASASCYAADDEREAEAEAEAEADAAYIETLDRLKALEHDQGGRAQLIRIRDELPDGGATVAQLVQSPLGAANFLHALQAGSGFEFARAIAFEARETEAECAFRESLEASIDEALSASLCRLFG